MADKIVVIGAGIEGLASAVALQRRGYDITVVQERTDTSTCAAISVWPNALAALDHIGLGDPVREGPVAGLLRAHCAGTTARGCAARRVNDSWERWASRSPGSSLSAGPGCGRWSVGRRSLGGR
jgi:2-polyprenyl-6-methoxyphenol hydroxylase-like FAD-dependent oxidoreductase